MEMVLFLNKWLHLLSICAVMGGTFFAWLILSHATSNDTEAESQFMKPLWSRFGISLAIFWVLALGTGFLNVWFVSPHVNGMYQLVLGMKIMLALLMFILTLALSHPLPAFKGIKQKRASWWAGLTLLGMAVVGISAHLNITRINGKGLTVNSAPTVISTPIPGTANRAGSPDR